MTSSQKGILWKVKKLWLVCLVGKGIMVMRWPNMDELATLVGLFNDAGDHPDDELAATHDDDDVG